MIKISCTELILGIKNDIQHFETLMKRSEGWLNGILSKVTPLVSVSTAGDTKNDKDASEDCETKSEPKTDCVYYENFVDDVFELHNDLPQNPWHVCLLHRSTQKPFMRLGPRPFPLTRKKLHKY